MMDLETRLGPAGDELTLDFAKALVENEGVGQDAVTDYLAMSFSSTFQAVSRARRLAARVVLP